ncbi:nudix hydrolase 26 chloroplastic [Phtheirospermum japonicum]|uniref:Nudix hydrolase 26 chloroplastic n=1 Tax=Phtheirospermum japonicum TaxID=374723 RepID=A0A830BTL2_9LAMI|nr:nudix hydrolase 26 chloroplastic [Phtheirospermum japonicum]
MALCRYFLHINSSPLQRINTTTLILPNRPHKLRKFTALSLPAPLSSVSSPSSMDTPPEGYRRNVRICLISPSKKIFVASRLDIPDAWKMPQGGIDESKDPKSVAIRELREVFQAFFDKTLQRYHDQKLLMQQFLVKFVEG